MSPTTGSRKESAAARVAGSGASGIAELMIFHPVDTISKRLMSNRANLAFQNLNAVVFRQHSDATAFRKFLSLSLVSAMLLDTRFSSVSTSLADSPTPMTISTPTTLPLS